MPLGTPHEYELARTAEMADVELDYPGRGKLDVHAAVEHTLEIADRFAEVVAAQDGFADDMDNLAGILESSARRREAVKGAVVKAGSMVVGALVWAGSYNVVYDREDNPIPVPWAFPF